MTFQLENLDLSHCFLRTAYQNQSWKSKSVQKCDACQDAVELSEEVAILAYLTVQRDTYAKKISYLEQGKIMSGTTIS